MHRQFVSAAPGAPMMPFRGRAIPSFAAMLTAPRLRRLAVCTLTVNVVLYATSVAQGRFPLDSFGVVVAQDFMGHLTGGSLIATGRASLLYDVPTQQALQMAMTGDPSNLDIFISPPLVAYAYAPFTLLSYGAGAALWTAISLALLAVCGVLAVRLTPSVPREPRALLLLLWAASFPLIMLLGSGQDTAVSLLLWAGGVLLALRRRDAASGLVFSLGLFKPQLFFLAPLVFLLLGRRRALAAWAGGAALQVALTLWLVGGRGVVAWLEIFRSPQYLGFLQTHLACKMTSLVPVLRSIVPDSLGSAARIVGGVLSAGLVAATFVRLRSGARSGGLDERAAWAIACLATLIATPHCFYYDLTLLLLPVALLMDLRGGLPPGAARNALIAAYLLCWTAPLRVLCYDSAWPLSVLNASWMPVPLFFLWRAIPTRAPEEAAARRAPGPVSAARPVAADHG